MNPAAKDANATGISPRANGAGARCATAGRLYCLVLPFQGSRLCPPFGRIQIHGSLIASCNHCRNSVIKLLYRSLKVCSVETGNFRTSGIGSRRALAPSNSGRIQPPAARSFYASQRRCYAGGLILLILLRGLRRPCQSPVVASRCAAAQSSNHMTCAASCAAAFSRDSHCSAGISMGVLSPAPSPRSAASC